MAALSTADKAIILEEVFQLPNITPVQIEQLSKKITFKDEEEDHQDFLTNCEKIYDWILQKELYKSDTFPFNLFAISDALLKFDTDFISIGELIAFQSQVVKPPSKLEIPCKICNQLCSFMLINNILFAAVRQYPSVEDFIRQSITNLKFYSPSRTRDTTTDTIINKVLTWTNDNQISSMRILSRLWLYRDILPPESFSDWFPLIVALFTVKESFFHETELKIKITDGKINKNFKIKLLFTSLMHCLII